MFSDFSKSDQRRALRGPLPGLVLVGLAAASLTGCGPQSGPDADASASASPAASSAASANAAQTSAASTTVAATPVAPPACPTAVAPKCPAPASAAPQRPAPVPAIWTHPARHWSGRRRVNDRDFDHAGAARRWEQGRPWPGDQPYDNRRDGERMFQGRFAGGHDLDDGLMGGPPGQFHGDLRGGYRAEEGSREIVQFQSSRAYGREGGSVEIYRREARMPQPSCLPCQSGWREGHRAYATAGVDERGFLVWPGKVEY